MRIGVIGLTPLGRAISARLVEHGFEVSVYDHAPGDAPDLNVPGTKRAVDLSEVCDVDVVFTALPDDRSIEQLNLRGMLENLPEGAVHICCSKMSVTQSRRLSAAHRRSGQPMLTVILLGGAEAVKRGRAILAVAGDDVALDYVAQMLEVLGSRSFHFGNDPTTATLLDLGTSFLEAAISESIYEATRFVAQGGVERAEYLEFVASTLFNVPLSHTPRELVLVSEPQPEHLSAAQMFVDIKLVMAAADDLQVSLPLASLLHDHLIERAGHAIAPGFSAVVDTP